MLALAVLPAKAQQQPLWHPVGGVFGGALEFDGIDDFGVFKSPLFDVGNKGTVSFWVKMNSPGKRNQFFEGPDDGGFEIQYRNNSGGQVYGRATTVGGDFVIRNGNDGAYMTNTWVNIQLIWDFNGIVGDTSAKMRVFINGNETNYLAGSTPTDLTWGAVVSTVDKMMNVGRDPSDPTRYFSGWMDDIAWFNDTLNATDRDNIRLNGASALQSDPRMVAHWDLDQSSGFSAFDSKNGIELKLSTDGVSPFGPTFLPSGGHFGGALEFDGVDDLATFNFGTNDLGSKGTLSFWTYMYDTSKRNEFFVGPGGGGLEFQYRNNSSGQVYTRTTPNSGDFVIRSGGDSSILLTNWVNIQVIWNTNGLPLDGGGTVRIYLNGVESTYLGGFMPTDLIWTNVVSTIDGIMTMGRDPGDATRFFKGRMDDVAWFNDVLTTGERGALRSNPAANSMTGDARMVAYWNLDDAPGTTLAPGNAGTSIPLYIQQVAPPFGPTFRPTGGRFGGALDFDGVNDFGAFSLGSHELGVKGTMSFWVKNRDISERHQFFEGPGNGGFEVQFRPNDGGQVYTRATTDGGDFVVRSGPDATAVLDNWVNIQVIWNFNGLSQSDGGGNLRIFLNGTESTYLTDNTPTDLSWPSVVSTIDGIMNVGRDPGDPTRYFDGLMDDVAFFDDVLTASERAALLTAPVADTLAGDPRLVAYWNLDDAPGVTEVPGNAGTTITLYLERVPPPKDIALFQGSDTSGTPIFDGQVGVVSVPDTTIGTPTTNDFTIFNEGGAILTLTNISIPSGFTLLNAPAPGTQLDPNESVTFQLVLNATSAGTFTGVVNVVSDDPDENPFNFNLSGVVLDHPPSDITLSTNVVIEQQPIGTLVGTLITDDQDIPGDTHVYSLVYHDGCEDNAYFSISGNQLLTASNLVYSSRSTYHIIIRTTDLGGLYYEEDFFIFVLPLPGTQPAPTFNNDFTANLNGWTRFPGFELTSDGALHGQVAPGSPAAPTAAVTDWGGYDTATVAGSGFITSLDFYLDTNTAEGLKFGYTVVLNNPAHAAEVEFAYLMMRTNVTGACGFLINTGTGAPGSFENPDGSADAPGLSGAIVVTNSGWYTFQHWFHTKTNAGIGYLTTEMSILDASTNVVATWVIDTTEIVGTNVLGNRYGKIFGNEFNSLLVDNSKLTTIPRPVALGTAAVVNEDESVPVRLAGYVYPASAPVRYRVTTGPTHGTLNVTTGSPFTNPTVTYTPSADYFGTDSFKYVVSNGAQDSLAVTVSLTVMSVNDAPSFALSVSSVTVAEDSAQTTMTIVNSASVSKGPANESGQLISYLIDPGYNTALFMTQPTVSSIGSLTFRPAPNASGNTTINVRAMDNGGTACGGHDTSGALPFLISITPSNDAPVLAVITNLTVSEGLTSTPTADVPLTITDIETPLANMSVSVVLSNQTGGIVIPASVGTNYSGGVWHVLLPVVAEQSGQVNVHVTATDTGDGPSPARSASRMFVFKVLAVNDAPGFAIPTSVHSAPGVLVTTAAFSTFYANGATPSDTSENAQTGSYTLTVQTADRAKFATLPTITSAGTLTYKFAAGASGSCVVQVKVTDNGGTAGGGVNVSPTQNLTFIVDP